MKSRLLQVIPFCVVYVGYPVPTRHTLKQRIPHAKPFPPIPQADRFQAVHKPLRIFIKKIETVGVVAVSIIPLKSISAILPGSG